MKALFTMLKLFTISISLFLQYSCKKKATLTNYDYDGSAQKLETGRAVVWFGLASDKLWWHGN